MIDMKVKIGKLVFRNPIWVASGTFGYGKEFEDFFELDRLGAVVTKTITLNAREGNPPPRVVETPSGILNSIGLENKGIEHFKKEYLPALREQNTRLVVSIAGFSKEDFERCAEKLSGKDPVDAIEINLSCPNVKHGHTRHSLIAQDPVATKDIVAAVRKRTKAVLIAKLTPNVTDIGLVAEAAERGGADAVSLINTYFGMAVDPETMEPLLGNVTGGVSGPAIKPMALKAVWDVSRRVRIPVIGIGGIMRGEDVVEFMLCGASAVQVGTANLVDPPACARIIGEFEAYLRRKRIGKARDLIGKLRVQRAADSGQRTERRT